MPFAIRLISIQLGEMGGSCRADFGMLACYRGIGMKKPDIAKRMARQAGVSPGEAADRLDRVVRDILSNLRKGKETAWPGLGRFTPGPDGQVAFQREPGGRHG
ncbi:hypothetical protein SBA3_4600010 [Candidatus Sulfopaludibacter sp. SbA3]|nr:hypothetical protein SBA3_4600010 [Candidatus Sulfopaludibacter sp. SbA3]